MMTSDDDEEEEEGGEALGVGVEIWRPAGRVYLFLFTYSILVFSVVV